MGARRQRLRGGGCRAAGDAVRGTWRRRVQQHHRAGRFRLRRRIDAAERSLAAAEEALQEIEKPWTVLAADVHGGHLCLARARQATERGEAAVAQRLRAEALERLARARGGTDPPAHAFADVRFACRLLERAVGNATPARASGAVPGALVIGAGTSWFCTPEGVRGALEQRRPLRRVLAGLVARRLETPGVPTSVPELLALGWPDERILTHAGATRVYNALTTLRAFGLRDLLLRTPDGYLLDPAVPVVQSQDDM